MKKTTEEFIKQANLVHNNKFNYSKTIYINSKDKVIIICPIHGEFEQIASNHLRYGCPNCCPNAKLDTEKFIKKAKEIHGDKYDYSKVNYINSCKKVIITCKKHGDFLIKPNDIITGYGCIECVGNKKHTTESFIEKSRLVHGDKYDYSKVEYKTNKDKVIITCPIHGDFAQAPNSHFAKQGCPGCKESRGEKEVAKTLTEMNISFVREKSFEGCRNINPLPFDFYIPSINTTIEFQGGQHFKSVKYFGGDKAFIELQKRDKIKVDYCTANNIKLIIIEDIKDIKNKIGELKC